MRPTIPDSGFISAGQEALRKMESETQPIWSEVAERREERDGAILSAAKSIEEIQQDLQQTRKQLAEQQAEYDKSREADALQRVKDKKQSFRHDFYVAAFSVAFTLLVENFGDIVAFFQKFFG